MDGLTPEASGKHVDLRLGRIEQFLPTLATRDELQAAVATLATKDELQAAVAAMATKVELQSELQAAVAKLATKAELQAGLQSVKDELRAELASKAELQAGLQSVKDELRAEIRAGDNETRHYMKILVEEVRGDIRILVENLSAMDARHARTYAELVKADAHLDRRVTALEAGRRRARSR